MVRKIFILLLILASASLADAQLKVGVARKSITPETPVWLTGYASRNKPSTEILHDLWAKALVIEENSRKRVVIVTLDILGLSHDISEEVTQRLIQIHGIDRSQLILNSSHTHSGPVIWPALSMIFDFSPEDQKSAVKYARKLTDDIVEVVNMAFASLDPVKLSYGCGTADFAVNRRQPTERGVVIGVNPEGPVDHNVPVMMAVDQKNTIKAILFGYACHNTTSSSYLVNGDYAGFAQIEIEKMYPGSVAMYIAGCGADQNPNPRGSLELAAQHGKTLADGVRKAMEGELRDVRPPVRTGYAVAELQFRPFDPEIYRKEITGSDIYMQRRARLMLEAYNKGWDMTKYNYPVQAVRFNNDFTLLALTGEVVIDYALAAKKKYPGENMFVAGYCTEVQCYIPSKRILSEGGYEPVSSMIYYGFPGPFADDVEERVMDAVSQVMKKSGAKR